MKEDLTDNKTRATVKIFGQEYLVKGACSSEHIKELAALVDQKMREIRDRSPSLAPAKVAVLTALNIADELSRVKSDYDSLMRMIDEERER